MICAIEVQRVLRARNASLSADHRMDFRMGIHMGDVRVEGGRIYGDGVNIAARLEALADAGGICISSTVHDQVRHRISVDFEDLGEKSVKNIPDPVRVYRALLFAAERAEAPAAGVAALLIWGTGGEFGSTARPPGPIRSIAVLPLDNLSGEAEQEFFVDGLTEELTATLARIRALRVISRTSAMQYKGVHKPLREIARELDVDGVIEGSVLRAGTQVRITAQLIRADADEHLWAESYTRELTDILALQQMAQLAMFQGRNEEAGELMARTFHADPTFTYGHLLHPVVRLYHNDLPGAEEALNRARQVIGDDPMLDASEALLWARRGEPGKAEAALTRAMQDKPFLGHIHHTWHYAAATYAVLGRPNDAIQKIREATTCGFPNFAVFRDDPHLASLREEPEMRHLLSELERECGEYRREFGRH